MDDFIKSLGLDYDNGKKTDNGDYSIKIDNSDEYAKVYTLLDTSDIVSLDTNVMKMDEHKSELFYNSDKYTVLLFADYDSDKYKCVISERK